MSQDDRDDGLQLPRAWTLRQGLVAEAIVIALESKRVEMPGMNAGEYSVQKLTDGRIVLSFQPHRPEE